MKQQTDNIASGFVANLKTLKTLLDQQLCSRPYQPITTKQLLKANHCQTC